MEGTEKGQIAVIYYILPHFIVCIKMFVQFDIFYLKPISYVLFICTVSGGQNIRTVCFIFCVRTVYILRTVGSEQYIRTFFIYRYAVAILSILITR